MMMPMQVKMTMLKYCKEVDASTVRNPWDHRHKHYTPPKAPKVQGTNLMLKGRQTMTVNQVGQVPNGSQMQMGGQMWGGSSMANGNPMMTAWGGNQMPSA
eukprot:CAMPEP_0197922372 /NCGR_PEP_ID=MMETSP1439-20131203/92230_1 /TAXON_ID=66791 /ORGANISM="Gonyaulax spinifera, Strain CCMP409" /LENGTH=99 /DNA_ID=CAMNT_0043544675 /DNA_START=1 /DNA_END=296 /DNA_ORIENTATION=-